MRVEFAKRVTRPRRLYWEGVRGLVRRYPTAAIQLADNMAPPIAKAYLEAMRGVQSRATMSRIAGAIENAMRVGTSDEAIRAAIGHAAIDELGSRLDPMVQTIRDAYRAGMDHVAGRVPKNVAARVRMDEMNPRAALYLHQHGADLVTRVGEQARESIKDEIFRGLTAGENPTAMARRIRDHIGLTPQQSQAVSNYRRMLQSGEASQLGESLTRALRDARSDGTVERVIRTGGTLSNDQIDSMVGRYRDRALKHRAETIARTESTRAVNAGNLEGARQIQEQTGSRMVKTWAATDDERTRDAHIDLDGQTVPVNEDFDSLLGPIGFPGDPTADAENTVNCRCSLTYDMEDDSEELGKWDESQHPRDDHGKFTAGGSDVAADAGGYKGHRPGSKLEILHRHYDEHGHESARQFARSLGLSEATFRIQSKKFAAAQAGATPPGREESQPSPPGRVAPPPPSPAKPTIGPSVYGHNAPGLRMKGSPEALNHLSQVLAANVPKDHQELLVKAGLNVVAKSSYAEVALEYDAHTSGKGAMASSAVAGFYSFSQNVAVLPAFAVHGNDTNGTVVHELGHALDYLMDRLASAHLYSNRPAFYQAVRAERNYLINATGASGPPDHLRYYGKNDKEMFAQAYAAVVMPQHLQPQRVRDMERYAPQTVAAVVQGLRAMGLSVPERFQ